MGTSLPRPLGGQTLENTRLFIPICFLKKLPYYRFLFNAQDKVVISNRQIIFAKSKIISSTSIGLLFVTITTLANGRNIGANNKTCC